MYPLLVLSTLSVGFYLFLLLALHRDARRRRRSVVVEFSDGTPIRLPKSRIERIGSRWHKNSLSEVDWHPVATIEWEPAQPENRSNNRKRVMAAAPVKSVTQLKCG